MSSLDDALSALLTERDAATRRLRDLNAAVDALRRLLPPALGEVPGEQQTRDRAEVADPELADSNAGTKDLILRLFRAPGDVLRVDDVYNELLASGWSTSSDRPRHMVASNLSKLALAGRLRKAGYGTYQRPPLFELRSELSAGEQNEGGSSSSAEGAPTDVIGPHGN